MGRQRSLSGVEARRYDVLGERWRGQAMNESKT